MQGTRPLTVLVVDDDPFIRATTKTALRSRGFEVLQAGNGQEGLNTFLDRRPDLLIVDLKMPVMSGLELLSHLSEVIESTPVLVISGEGGLDEAITALRLGAWDYLVKPIVSPAVLHHAVDKALERAALIRENEEYRQDLERQVQQRTLELQQANLELEHQFLKQQKLGIIGTIAGGMAHDFNNILASVVFSTELIRGAIDSGEAPDQEDLERILRVCQRGTSLIRSVLHFTGKMHEEFTHFSIRDTLIEALEIIRGTTPSHITIQASLDQNLGTLLGDPVHLQQIIMNLVTNAVRALAETASPRIDITARSFEGQDSGLLVTDPDSSLTVITVSDNGSGISEDDLPRLCEPFFTTKPREGGTGLGLFVTQKIVKSLRGKLIFSPNETAGLTVQVCLPASPQLPEDSAENRARPEIMGCGERILVVESDPEVRAAVCSCLERLGYAPYQTESLMHGLEFIENHVHGLDLVLTEDSTAGQVDELCATLGRIGRDIPVLLTSASPAPGLESRPEPVRRVISKPVDMHSLGRALRQCLTQAHYKI
jgi:signal transduction histidine kinase